MAEEIAMAEVMNLLEAEPAALPAAWPAALPGPDIPALREQLAIVVSEGKCKESIGVNLTHEQVNRLEDKDLMKFNKRLEAHVGAKTTQTQIDRFLSLLTKALGYAVRLKDPEALKNELKNDYVITKELSYLSAKLALRCGHLLAVVNTFLIAAEHVDFDSKSRDSDGYPIDEVDNAVQSPPISE